MAKLDERKNHHRHGRVPFRPILGQLRARWLIERLVGSWSTTPGKFRIVRATLALMLLAAGTVGGYVANMRPDLVQEIANRTGPLSMDATDLYRSLAEANATVTSSFLAGGAEPVDVSELYDTYIPRTAEQLADAAARTSDDRVATNRIADIGAQLPRYTGLVEQARANNGPGSSTGVDDLQAASDLMQSTALQAAQQLQSIQTKRLEAGYQQAESVPVLVLVLVLFVTSLAGLVWVQIVLFRRTKRVFNPGLVVSTLMVVAALLWWVVAGVIYGSHLADSSRHSKSITSALGPAQIAALQARASENLALLARDGDMRDRSEEIFSAQAQILAMDDGAGGALGAAAQDASDDRGRTLVQAALTATRGYLQAHDQVRELNNAGRHDEAVAAAVGAGNTSATAFSRLDQTLAAAVDYERKAFDNDLTQAEDVLSGLFVGTVLLMFTAAIGVLWGISQRLREYLVSAGATGVQVIEVT